MLGVSNERRAESGIAPGETYDVEVTSTPRPARWRCRRTWPTALAADAEAKIFFDTLSYSKQPGTC